MTGHCTVRISSRHLPWTSFQRSTLRYGRISRTSFLRLNSIYFLPPSPLSQAQGGAPSVIFWEQGRQSNGCTCSFEPHDWISACSSCSIRRLSRFSVSATTKKRLSIGSPVGQCLRESHCCSDAAPALLTPNTYISSYFVLVLRASRWCFYRDWQRKQQIQKKNGLFQEGLLGRDLRCRSRALQPNPAQQDHTLDQDWT